MEFRRWIETVEQSRSLRYYRTILGLPFGFLKKDNAYQLLDQAFEGKEEDPDAKEAYQVLHRELDRVHGRHFDDFFSKVTKGDKLYKTDVPFEYEYDMSEHEPWLQNRQPYYGDFDLHIKTSIPTYGDLQDKKGHAIVRAFGNQEMKMLDIGGSEGSFARIITKMSGGNIETDILDPNESMRDFYYSKGETPGSRFLQASFLTGWINEDGTRIPAISADNHPDRYDIVNESMTFQFINNRRGTHVAEAKRLMEPHGLLLTEEKVQAPDKETWERNERFKDIHHKSRYYPKDKLQKKNQVVAFAGAKDQEEESEVPVVGMANNMVTVDALEKILLQNFGHVWQYWDAGNFKGYAASDNSQMVNQFLQALGPTESRYSTVTLPRQVGTQQESFAMTRFSEWLANTSKKDKNEIRSAILSKLPEGWDDMTDEEIKEKLGDKILQAVGETGQSATFDDLDELLDMLDDWEFQKQFDIATDYLDLC